MMSFRSNGEEREVGGSLSGKRLGQRRREERGWRGQKRQHGMWRKKREAGK
jgi:hypothetical protein